MILLYRFLFLAALLAAAPAAAQQQPPVRQGGGVIAPLAQVKQLVVTEPTISDSKVAAECRLDAKAIQAHIAKIVQGEELPLVADAASATDTAGKPVQRVLIRPELATIKDGVVNCTSWVGIRVEAQHLVRLAPINERKMITANYWSRGGLVLTPIVEHDLGVLNAYTLLIRALARQYKIDNPKPIATAP